MTVREKCRELARRHSVFKQKFRSRWEDKGASDEVSGGDQIQILKTRLKADLHPAIHMGMWNGKIRTWFIELNTLLPARRRYPSKDKRKMRRRIFFMDCLPECVVVVIIISFLSIFNEKPKSVERDLGLSFSLRLLLIEFFLSFQTFANYTHSFRISQIFDYVDWRNRDDFRITQEKRRKLKQKQMNEMRKTFFDFFS